MGLENQQSNADGCDDGIYFFFLNNLDCLVISVFIPASPGIR